MYLEHSFSASNFKAIVLSGWNFIQYGYKQLLLFLFLFLPDGQENHEHRVV